MRSERLKSERLKQDQCHEEGFALIALVVAIFLVLLVLGLAAPRVAQELRHDREVEAVHRANQYVRAIQVFYKKNGRYPITMDQLEKTNNVRYLRQKYVDPTTGKADWRLIHLGEAKTTVKGFFGQPLSGLNTQNIGTGIGGASNVNSTGTTGASGAAGSAAGGSSFGSGSSSGSTGAGGGFSLAGGVGGTSAGGSSTSASGTSTNSNGGVGSQSATDFKGGGGAIVGIGSAASGTSILELNEQTTYQTWEFLYDPRIEQMKARASLFGGGVTAANATTFGAPGSGISPATSTPSTTTPAPTTSTPTPP